MEYLRVHLIFWLLVATLLALAAAVEDAPVEPALVEVVEEPTAVDSSHDGERGERKARQFGFGPFGGGFGPPPPPFGYGGGFGGFGGFGGGGFGRTRVITRTRYVNRFGGGFYG